MDKPKHNAVDRPKGPKGVNCPLHKKPMSQVCHTCAWWVGIGPDHAMVWNCAQVHSAAYAFESAKHTFAVGAAVESTRNEQLKMHQQRMEADSVRDQIMERDQVRAVLQASGARLIEGRNA